MSSTFAGFALNLSRFDPNPRTMIHKTEDVERTGLDGVEVKRFGQRPLEFEADGIFQEISHTAMNAQVLALLSMEKTVGTLTYEGDSFSNVELFMVTLGARRTSNDGPVQRYRLTFRTLR